MRRLFAIPFALLLAAVAAHGAELGDPAAKLNINEWIKGDPVQVGRGDTVYVVEFWATWCPPCRKSIPHLTELQKKYQDKGVKIVSVSNEEASTVRPFVDDMGEKMDYTLAVDKNDQTFKAYMGAYNRNGIPSAFVVDKQGRVVWAGHPMSGLDEVLEELVSGDFDFETVKRLEEAKQHFREFAGHCQEGNSEQAHKMAREGLQKYGDIPMYLSAVSWTLMTSESLDEASNELALKIAKKAVESTGGKQPSTLDTYARALFETGDVTGAIDQQKKALELTTNDEQRKLLEEGLDKYEEAQEGS